MVRGRDRGAVLDRLLVRVARVLVCDEHLLEGRLVPRGRHGCRGQLLSRAAVTREQRAGRCGVRTFGRHDERKLLAVMQVGLGPRAAGAASTVHSRRGRSDARTASRPSGEDRRAHVDRCQLSRERAGQVGSNGARPLGDGGHSPVLGDALDGSAQQRVHDLGNARAIQPGEVLLKELERWRHAAAGLGAHRLEVEARGRRASRHEQPAREPADAEEAHPAACTPAGRKRVEEPVLELHGDEHPAGVRRSHARVAPLAVDQPDHEETAAVDAGEAVGERVLALRGPVAEEDWRERVGNSRGGGYSGAAVTREPADAEKARLAACIPAGRKRIKEPALELHDDEHPAGAWRSLARVAPLAVGQPEHEEAAVVNAGEASREELAALRGP
eukprot:CAMPEP_0180003024 /NCGR_PEP_ID=MMETSP0984-20121128/11271_1 /TAXON_ID=483367 /ORGANISM="non described non described, Strain CCMP 2436" /LENGTH=386 /DNA_ID=CAMNT_0021923301 /DNA_START=350 /DNA_END=1507 /DNA_ORIENTATION=+